MKKYLLVIITFLLCFTLVNAEEESFTVKDVKAVKSSDGVILNDTGSVNATFNDLNQQVKYEAIIHNNTEEVLFIHDIDLENVSEEFFDAELDTKSQNMMIEPNGSTKVYFYINTITKEGAGRELNDTIDILFKINDKNLNPQTYTNILEILFLVIILFTIFYFINNKNKKRKLTLFIVTFTILGLNIVYADEFMLAKLSGNISYVSQNTIETTGTILSGKKADYTNSKDVWKYANEIKNVYIKSLINEPNKYFEKFDLSQNNDGRVIGYLVENEDEDIPYDLYIMSNGVVKANEDSSFLFSFPNIDKVNGLNNIDFRSTTSMKGMFLGNKNLKKVDIESLEMDNTKDTSFMFYNCNKIEHTIEDFNLENVENFDSMLPFYLYNKIKNNVQTDKNENFANTKVNTGKYVMDSTKDNTFPIYYYRGDIKDNNVSFAGYCWQIVRTTENGGIKLLFNGKVKENNNCNITIDDENHIGATAYNTEANNIESVGYITKNKEYNTLSKSYTLYGKGMLHHVIFVYGTSDVYYSKTYTYSNGTYTLSDPKQYNWSTDYNNLVGYYTCDSKDPNYKCKKIYYIVKTNNKNRYAVPLEKNEDPNEVHIKIAQNFTYDENSKMYTLTNPIKVLKKNWHNNYYKYTGYYACSNLIDNQCSELFCISNPDETSFEMSLYEKIVYGNNVEYKNGKYKLINKYTSKNYNSNYKTISNKYHYTCLNDKDECENVNYIYNSSSLAYYMLTLSDGIKYEDVKNTIFKNYNKDSNIKETIEKWYQENLYEYGNSIENESWCNDRSFSSTGFNGLNSTSLNSKLSTSNRISNKIISLNCINEEDRLFANNTNNSANLKYPIGLLTIDEVRLAGIGNRTNNVYLSENNKNGWWTMSPAAIASNVSNYAVNGIYFRKNVDAVIYVRPSIVLKNKIKYTTGDGTKENPYVIEKIEQ